MTVRYERRDATAVVTMDRPEYRNAQNSAMTYALDAAFARAVDDDEVSVIVLAGAGEHFSAGHDIGSPGRDVDKSFDRKAVLWWDHVGRGGGDQRFAREMEVYLGMCRRWREIPKPTIAMVQGACVAGGLMLAWCCDLVIAADDARFIEVFVRRGIALDAGGGFLLPRHVGLHKAKELVFFGDDLSASDAERLGLVNRVVPAADFERELEATIAKFLALPPTSVRASKALTARAFDVDFDAFRREMQAHFKVCLDSDEHRAAMDAIRGRRSATRP
jgi:enoyl-CoA hydratase